jgi:hypothetical protein
MNFKNIKIEILSNFMCISNNNDTIGQVNIPKLLISQKNSVKRKSCLVRKKIPKFPL